MGPHQNSYCNQRILPVREDQASTVARSDVWWAVLWVMHSMLCKIDFLLLLLSGVMVRYAKLTGSPAVCLDGETLVAALAVPHSPTPRHALYTFIHLIMGSTLTYWGTEDKGLSAVVVHKAIVIFVIIHLGSPY